MAVDKIPFDEKGNMREYAGYGVTEWRDNTPFKADLQVCDYERGRSAVRVIMEDTISGARYPVFISDFLDIVKHDHFAFGGIDATWVGGKKGQNYGLKLAAA